MPQLSHLPDISHISETLRAIVLTAVKRFERINGLYTRDAVEVTLWSCDHVRRSE